MRAHCAEVAREPHPRTAGLRASPSMRPSLIGAASSTRISRSHVRIEGRADAAHELGTSGLVVHGETMERVASWVYGVQFQPVGRQRLRKRPAVAEALGTPPPVCCPAAAAGHGRPRFAGGPLGWRDGLAAIGRGDEPTRCGSLVAAGHSVRDGGESWRGQERDPEESVFLLVVGGSFAPRRPRIPLAQEVVEAARGGSRSRPGRVGAGAREVKWPAIGATGPHGRGQRKVRERER